VNDYIPSALPGLSTAQYRMPLTVGEHSARHIRRIVRSFLREWEMEDLVESAELAVTELIANVVRHVPDRRCTVRVLRQPAGVRVEVADGCARLPTAPTDVPPESESGRGLVLLDAVVDDWGVVPAPGGGKTVWFECRAG